MSAAILAIPGKKHQVPDNLEAFIHVLQWMCLHFYSTGIPSSKLCEYVSTIFDNYTIVNGEEVGGHIKLTQIAQGISGISLGHNNVMGTILDRLALLCQQHYFSEYLSLIEPQQHSRSTPRLSGPAPTESVAESEAESEADHPHREQSRVGCLAQASSLLYKTARARARRADGQGFWCRLRNSSCRV